MNLNVENMESKAVKDKLQKYNSYQNVFESSATLFKLGSQVGIHPLKHVLVHSLTYSSAFSAPFHLRCCNCPAVLFVFRQEPLFHH